MVRAVTPIPFVKARFFDRCGKPLTGGQIYTYEANTTTPKVTYKDPYGLTPNTNPIILDAAGEADIYLDGTYRIRITDRNDVLVNDVAKIGSWFSDNLQDTLDNISGAMDDAIKPVLQSLDDAINTAAAAGAGANGWTDLLIALTSGRNLRDKLTEIASAKDYGAIGDGVKDDTASIQRYANFLMSNGGGVLKLTKGNYRITSTITIDGKISIVGERGAKITVDASVEAFEIKNANGQGMTDLEIDGKDRAFYGLSLWNTDYYLFDNVYVHNTGGTDPMRGDGTGIRLVDSNFVIATRCKTVDIGGDGILTLQCKHVVIDSCWSERCKRHNYSFSEYQSKKYSEHCVLINSTGIDSVLSGIDLESGVRCTVVNNNFLRSGKYLNTNDNKGDLLSAIATNGWAYGNRITNNTIIDSQTDGIFVVQPPDESRTNEYGLEPVATIISDNYILNAGRHGVFISGNGHQSNDKQSWSVHSNIIHSPAKNGIKLGWTTINANVHNNTITNSGEVAISGASNYKCNISHNNIDTNSDGISLEYSKNLIILANNININGTNKKYINIDMSANAAENIIIANNITNADLANSANLLNIYARGGAKNIKVHGNVGSGTGYPFITFNLGDFDKQTVKIEHNGFEYVKGSGWINKAEIYITSINSIPDYVGQMAIVGGSVYIATGTTANTDWKRVTNETA